MSHALYHWHPPAKGNLSLITQDDVLTAVKDKYIMNATPRVALSKYGGNLGNLSFLNSSYGSFECVSHHVM